MHNPLNDAIFLVYTINLTCVKEWLFLSPTDLFTIRVLYLMCLLQCLSRLDTMQLSPSYPENKDFYF